MAQATSYPGILAGFHADSSFHQSRAQATGIDASIAPLESDFKKYAEGLIEAFFRNVPVIRAVAQRYDTVSFADGTFQHEAIEVNDIGEAMIAMEAGEDNTNVTATPSRTPLPEIFKTASMTDRQWATTIGGMNRMNIIQDMITPKIIEAETVVGFRGVADLGINGLIGSATSDIGSPTGVWDVDTGSDGRLTNVIKDCNIAKNKILAITKNPLQVIDAVVTMPIYQLLADTVYEETPGYTNLQWFQEKILRGGQVLVSDLIQAAVTVDLNTMVLVPKVEANKAPFELITSGFDASIKSPKHWTTSLGIREIFGINIFKTQGKLVHWMDGIDCKT